MFFFFKDTLSLHTFVKINLESVKVRAIHTGKLRLSANGDTASAAHSRTVDHDRVQGNHGVKIQWTGHIYDILHHDQRTDGDTLIVDFSLVEKILENCRNKSFCSKTSVICRYVYILSKLLKLVGKQNILCALSADDHVYLRAHGSQLAKLRI